jgi:hypothetical protein
MYTNNPNSSVRVKYAIVHITKGRIRIRIPKLKYDREYQYCLKKLVESLRFVTGVRINPAAQSIVIHYDEWAWTFVSLQKKLAVAIQEAANIDVLVPTSVQNTRSFQNGSSKEGVSLPKNVNFSLDSTSSNFLKSKEKSTELDLVKSVSSVASQTQICKPPTMVQVEKFKAVNVQSPQKPVVKNSDNSIESNGFFVPPHFSTTERKTYSSNSSPNTDKRFRIVFLQTRATASPLRSSKHEKIVDYKQLSQQIQTIHRTRGKILSINAIA